MGTGKCRKYQLAGIRMTWMDRNLTASLINFNDLIDMFDVQLWIDTLENIL